MGRHPDAGFVRDRILYGTTEPTHAAVRLQAGALSADILNGGIRALCWRGVEAVRGIDLLIRDENWGTLQPDKIDEEHNENGDSFYWRWRFTLADGALECLFSVRGEASGRLSAEAEILAHRQVACNRAGLTVLHPIDGVAGQPLTVRHGGGTEQTRFPTGISPAQPVFDIVGLSHAVGPVEIDIAFDGETFEMEDQRNWTDASFKTYCRPLSWPAPFILSEGERIRQTVTVAISDRPQGILDKAPSQQTAFSLSAGSETLPEVMLAVEQGWLSEIGQPNAIASSGVGRLLARVTRESADDLFAALKRAAPDLSLDLEAVVPDERSAAAEDLARIADSASSHGIRFDYVIAHPAAYLKSHQPDGQWPKGLPPAEAARLARQAFPQARIGNGMLTNFTEFNRHRPDPSACDYVTHGTTAIVHAADDRSVIETLEALPHVFASARSIAGSTPYRLGLVSISMRSNPYGARLADNPHHSRVPMAGHDPRQRGLFAAAWAVGAAAGMEGFGIEALALAAPAGPFAIGGNGIFLPIHHVVRALARAGGAPRLRVTGLPASLAAVAHEREGQTRLLVANLGSEAVEWSPPAGALARRLDVTTAAEAARDPEWLDNPDEPVERLPIDGFAVVALKWRTEPR